MRYLRGVDRKEWDLIRSAYWPDAVHDHGEVQGSVEELIEWIQKWHATIPRVMHFHGNELIELNGDVAIAEFYLITYQEEADANGEPQFFVIGNRYLDRYERRNGEWKIAYRVVPLTFTRPPSPGADSPIITDSIQSQRDRSDRLWAMREAAGLS
jgi:hypothetical protein